MTLQFNSAHRPRELLSAALSKLNNGERICLATLVNIEGSAPYPIGAQMLIDEQGTYSGQISGGCAEQAIADQAALAIAAQENQTHRYGLDSPYFDIKLPCGSGIDVYFDCQLSVAELRNWLADLDAGRPVEQCLPTAIGEHTKVYVPTSRLLLFGQGPILVALAELALRSGFDVACIAQNEETMNRCQQADLVVQALQQNTQFGHCVNDYSAVVSLFHEHAFEDAILLQALQTNAVFIGALGSRKTHQARCDSLRSKGVSEAQLQRIQGPVGLPIQASTPAEIGVSILAEVIKSVNLKLVDLRQQQTEPQRLAIHAHS